MRLDTRKTGDVSVVAASGTITLLDPPGVLKGKVAALVQEGQKNIVLNLAELTFVDSSCLGELVACSLAVARAGGTLKLASPARRIQELLLITRLGPIFESFESDAAAVASFATDK